MRKIRITSSKLFVLLILISTLVPNLFIFIQNRSWVEYTYLYSDYEQEFKRLETLYGVQIQYPVKISNSDKTTQKLPEDFKVTAAHEWHLGFYSQELPELLKYYPREVVSKHLHRISLHKSLEYKGVPVGGYYQAGTIYLAYGDAAQIGAAFHHEFSIALKRSNSFPEAKWRAANDGEVEYGNLLSQWGEAVVIKKEYYQKGILNNYGFVSVEADLKQYAKTVFSHPRTMKRLNMKYPRVKQKYLLLRDFYLRIDPRFMLVFDRVL